MLRHEQLDRNFTYSTIRHSNRDVRGLKRNDSRNDLRHRHTIAGRIFLSNQAAGQLGIREPVKRTDGEDQASPGYASWRKENFHF